MKTNKLLILASAILVGGALMSPSEAAVAKAADEGYLFNGDTDLYLDDLEGNDDRRTFSATGATQQSFGYLDVDLEKNVVNSEETCDDSVYKIGTTGDQANSTISLTVYLSGDVDRSKSKIKVRGGANGTPDYPSETGFALNETVDDDGVKNSNIPLDEWTTININVAMTFAGVNFVQGSTSVPVSGGVSGFHLYNLAGNHGNLKIRDVKVGQVVDDFINRPGTDVAYWYGTQGNLVDTSVTLENGSYSFNYGEAIDYSNIGLELLGDLSGLSIATISGGTTGTFVPYADLVDYEGSALPSNLDARSTVTVNLADSGIASLDDLAGKAVITQVDSAALDVLEGDQASLTATFASLETIGEYNTAFMQLESGAVDAVACDLSIAEYQMAANEGAYTQLPEMLSEEHYAVGFKKGDDATAEAVNEALRALVEDGTVQELCDKYAEYGLSFENWVLE